MQDDDVVAEVVELEFLKRWHDPFAVMLLVENAESQNEERVASGLIGTDESV
jgi:hypothetical protein